LKKIIAAIGTAIVFLFIGGLVLQAIPVIALPFIIMLLDDFLKKHVKDSVVRNKIMAFIIVPNVIWILTAIYYFSSYKNTIYYS